MYRNYSDLNKEKMRQAQAQLQTSRRHIPGCRSNLNYNRIGCPMKFGVTAPKWEPHPVAEGI